MKSQFCISRQHPVSVWGHHPLTLSILNQKQSDDWLRVGIVDSSYAPLREITHVHSPTEHRCSDRFNARLHAAIFTHQAKSITDRHRHTLRAAISTIRPCTYIRSKYQWIFLHKQLATCVRNIHRSRSRNAVSFRRARILTVFRSQSQSQRVFVRRYRLPPIWRINGDPFPAFYGWGWGCGRRGRGGGRSGRPAFVAYHRSILYACNASRMQCNRSGCAAHARSVHRLLYPATMLMVFTMCVERSRWDDWVQYVICMRPSGRPRGRQTHASSIVDDDDG